MTGLSLDAVRTAGKETQNPALKLLLFLWCGGGGGWGERGGRNEMSQTSVLGRKKNQGEAAHGAQSEEGDASRRLCRR